MINKRIRLECEWCGGNKETCGITLDTKNLGTYPDQVCHSYVEQHFNICGTCATKFHEFLRTMVKVEEI